MSALATSMWIPQHSFAPSSFEVRSRRSSVGDLLQKQKHPGNVVRLQQTHRNSVHRSVADRGLNCATIGNTCLHVDSRTSSLGQSKPFYAYAWCRFVLEAPWQLQRECWNDIYERKKKVCFWAVWTILPLYWRRESAIARRKILITILSVSKQIWSQPPPSHHSDTDYVWKRITNLWCDRSHGWCEHLSYRPQIWERRLHRVRKYPSRNFTPGENTPCMCL